MQTNASSSFHQPRRPEEGDDVHGRSLYFDNKNNNIHNNDELEMLSIPSLSNKQCKSSPHVFKLQPLHTPRPIQCPPSATTIDSLLDHLDDRKKRSPRTPATFNSVVYLGYSSAESYCNVDTLKVPRLEEDDASETKKQSTLTRSLPRGDHYFRSLETFNYQ